MKTVCKYCNGTGRLTKRMNDKIVREKFKKAQQAQKEGRVPSVWLPMISTPFGKRKRIVYFCDQCDSRRLERYKKLWAKIFAKETKT
jgi:hypothetical protein